MRRWPREYVRDRSFAGSAPSTSTLRQLDEAENYFLSGRGLSHELVEAIAEHKQEPDWMRRFRHKSLDYFLARPLPTWAATAEIDFDNIYYYIKPTEKQAERWRTSGRHPRHLGQAGHPRGEKKYLAGVGAQYESEVVYHKLQADLEAQGVLFLDMDSGLREHEDIVKQYFGTIIPQNDNKFAALNSASLVGRLVHLRAAGRPDRDAAAGLFPDQRENMGQFERTLIIVDEDAYVHYVEGCTAPIYSSDSLHSAVVEIIVKPRGRCRYTTIQNWSNNVYNLVTARRRLRGRDDGVGRREPGVEADDEVPGDLADGRPRSRRGALDRLRR